MTVIKELIRKESNGTISFGDYTLPEKKKLADFEVSGDVYKVKTWNGMTKLERNSTFVYESIPGTAVSVFQETADKVSFFVDGDGNTQITLELESNRNYEIVAGEKNCLNEIQFFDRILFNNISPLNCCASGDNDIFKITIQFDESILLK